MKTPVPRRPKANGAEPTHFENTIPDDILQAAQWYLQRGWNPLPLAPPTPGKERSGKKPTIKAWQVHITTEEDIRHWFKPNSRLNIGLLCGCLGGIVVLDFDEPGAYCEWADRNPDAADTWTVARDNAEPGRCHCYFRLESGQRPPASTSGTWGDLQSNGKQVVAPPSVHYTGGRYRLINDTCPKQWNDDYLPVKTGGVTKSTKDTKNKEQRDKEERCVCDVLDARGGKAESLKHLLAESLRAESNYREKHPQRAHLYDVLVDRRFVAEHRQRNTVLTRELVPFLLDAVSQDIAMEFAECFYRFNHMTFRDPLTDHMRQAAHVWNALEEGYPERLTEDEKIIYEALVPRERELFRIARSLALDVEKSPAGPYTFNLPMHHHGIRLGLPPKHGMQVSRIVRRFRRFGIIEIVKRGTASRLENEKVIRGESSDYRWLLAE